MARLPMGFAIAQPMLRAAVLAVHGDMDEVVPIMLSRDFVEHAARTRGERDAVRVAGCDHIDLIKPELRNWKAILARVSKLSDNRNQG